MKGGSGIICICQLEGCEPVPKLQYSHFWLDRNKANKLLVLVKYGDIDEIELLGIKVIYM